MNITAAAWTAGFQWRRCGDITRTQNVSEYMLVRTRSMPGYILRESYTTQNVLWSRASLCVCLSAAVRPHYCTDRDVTWGRGRGCPLVVHYWADFSIPRYDDIVRTAGWAGSARAAGR